MKEKLVKDVSIQICDYFSNESIGNTQFDYNTVNEILYNSFGFLFDIIEDEDNE